MPNVSQILSFYVFKFVFIAHMEFAKLDLSYVRKNLLMVRFVWLSVKNAYLFGGGIVHH